MILVIATSKPEAVIALVQDDAVLAERRFEADPTLGRRLLEALDELLAEVGKEKTDIRRIAVHRGPGHFMSLRTGITTASTLAQALGAELVEVAGDKIDELIKQAEVIQPVAVVNPVYD